MELPPLRCVVLQKRTDLVNGLIAFSVAPIIIKSTYPDNFKDNLKYFKEPFNHDLYMTT